LQIVVCHFPPGTSKWNKIEHRMFCHITENWRGKPLVSRAVVVNLIGSTRTRSGLHIDAELDTNTYEKGIKVSDEEIESVRLKKDQFHGDWNYRRLIRDSRRLLDQEADQGSQQRLTPLSDVVNELEESQVQG
jgi:hypothetical protein